MEHSFAILFSFNYVPALLLIISLLFVIILLLFEICCSVVPATLKTDTRARKERTRCNGIWGSLLVFLYYVPALLLIISLLF